MTWRDRLTATLVLTVGLTLWIAFPMVMLWAVVIPACALTVLACLTYHAMRALGLLKAKPPAHNGTDIPGRRLTLTVLK